MRSFLLLLSMLISPTPANDRPDLLIADFDAPDYGAWKTDGTAFGPAPAQGALPGQMSVSGFEGNGLVNSFFQGDNTEGTLTSPEFRIERKQIQFLLGGGRHPNETCVNLEVNGQTVQLVDRPE